MAESGSKVSITPLGGGGVGRVLAVLGGLLVCALGCSAISTGNADNSPGEPLTPPNDASPVAGMALETLNQHALIGRIDPMFKQGVSYRVMGSFSEDGTTYHAVCADTEEPIWWFCLAVSDDGRLKQGNARFYLLAGPEGAKFRTHYQPVSPARSSKSPLFRIVEPGASDSAEVTAAIATGPYPQAWDKEVEGRSSAPDLDFGSCDSQPSDGDAIKAVLRAVVRVRALESQGVSYEVYVRSVAETAADISVAATELGEPCRLWLDHVGWIVEKYSLAGKIWGSQLQRHALADSEFDANVARHKELVPLRLQWQASSYRPLMVVLWEEAGARVEALLAAARSRRGE